MIVKLSPEMAQAFSELIRGPANEEIDVTRVEFPDNMISDVTILAMQVNGRPLRFDNVKELDPEGDIMQGVIVDLIALLTKMTPPV